MGSTLMSSTPAIDRSSFFAAACAGHTAPNASLEGTGVSRTRTSVVAVSAFTVPSAQVAFGARTTDLPGLPPRGAPV